MSGEDIKVVLTWIAIIMAFQTMIIYYALDKISRLNSYIRKCGRREYR